MAKDKYGKYIFNDKDQLMVHFGGRNPFLQVRGIKQWPGMACQIAVAPISQPLLMEATPMKHDFDQILVFMGSNTSDIFEFDAEVEFCLGDEQEKHLIKSPSVIYIPKGLTHCPINFKKIGKPIIFLDITLTTAYTRKEKTGDGWSGTVKDEEVKERDIQKFGLK
jgi:hypothetical protein